MTLKNQSYGRDDRWSRSFGKGSFVETEYTYAASVKVLASQHANMPEYQTDGAAGFDLESLEEVALRPGKTTLVSTGLYMIIPEGYEGQIRSRSSLALKGIIITNSPGTIDSDYRGEIKVIMHNLGSSVYKIEKGSRIAQMVISKLPSVRLEEVSLQQWANEAEDNKTERDSGGFGSTGL